MSDAAPKLDDDDGLAPERGHSIVAHASTWGPSKSNSIGNAKGQSIHAWEAAADKIHPVGR